MARTMHLETMKRRSGYAPITRARITHASYAAGYEGAALTGMPLWERVGRYILLGYVVLQAALYIAQRGL